MQTLKCEKMTKAFGKNTVLQELDLALEAGKIYGLIGRNGAGKTTLLSCISNHAPVTSGCVTLNGENIWENRKALDHICFSRELNVSQQGSLGTVSVKHYLEVAAAYLPHWDKEMAQQLLTLFKLDTKQLLSKLSKGMLSMVTIIVALASKARFTFLDEPVAGLDVVAREQFYKLLLDEFTKTGRTFVISTHIIEEAADVMEEVIMLDKGKIILKENTQELMDRACYVSGLTEQVEQAVAGLTCYHPQAVGRGMGVTVLLKAGESIPSQYDVTVQPVNLQKLFVAMCAGEAE